MSIKIQTEKLIVGGKKMRKIISMVALKENELPPIYKSEYPYCYLSEIGNTLIIQTKYERIGIFLYQNTIMPESKFQAILKYINQCGKRLRDINKAFKNAEKETITI